MIYNEHDPFPGDGQIPEIEYSGLKIKVLGEYSARKYTPVGNEVCISITTRPGRASLNVNPVPLHAQFHDVLRLQFDDTAVSHEHDPDARSITTAQAQQVAEFVARHTDKDTLVIHCFAGMSRSRSMAAAIADHLDIPFRFTVLNNHVYQSIKNAFEK